PQPLRSHRRAAAQSAPAAHAQGNPGDIVSPMQAIVVSLAVSNGDRVEEGQLVAVLEAMKMEKPLLAPRSGVVTGLGVSQGDTVGAGALICHIEAAGQEDQ
ncbi:Biotin-requiring enzyme, partial [Actinomyces sp. oral taxon 877 str. F0543]